MLIQLDPSVVRRAQRGDEKAFAEIVRTYHVPIFNYVLRSIGDRELAEDLTQEVFLRVWKALPRYAFRAKLTTWIFQVAKNVVLDDIRSRKNRLEQLNVDLKTALLLRDVVGMSYNEIAAALDVPLATVKWRIYSARNDVQAALAEAGVTLGPPDESVAETA